MGKNSRKGTTAKKGKKGQKGQNGRKGQKRLKGQRAKRSKSDKGPKRKVSSKRWEKQESNNEAQVCIAQQSAARVMQTELRNKRPLLLQCKSGLAFSKVKNPLKTG